MPTTLAERKLRTIALLAKLKDEDVLLLIEQLLMDATAEDWADQLSEAEKTSIRTGLEQLDAGKGEDLDFFKKRMEAKNL